MSSHHFPELSPVVIEDTRDALHGYSQVLGNWLKLCRPKRKHWWHASLRPSLSGFTTGTIHADIDFEIELDINHSQLHVRTLHNEQLSEGLHGQSSMQLAKQVSDFLLVAGINKQLVPDVSKHSDTGFSDYSETHAANLGGVFNSVSGAMQLFRAGIREETSPIQLWPHHFDLSMLWLPGGKIPDKDPDDEEYSDQQMNFGFTLGDSGIPEPYFYVTAYPLPEALPELALPEGTRWQTDGFDGAVLRYRELTSKESPQAYLLSLWKQFLAAGRQHMPKLAV